MEQQGNWDEVRGRVNEIVQRLTEDGDLQEQMKQNPEETLTRAGLSDEAAVILADDWRGATGHAAERLCEINKSCRFTESTDPCGPTLTTLRNCGSVRCPM